MGLSSRWGKKYSNDQVGTLIGAGWVHASSAVADLAGRLANRVQLTTDGHRAYLNAVEDAFGGDIDYAMLVKIYGSDQTTEGQRRYSPAECTGADVVRISGNPAEKDISTSYIELQNLTMRMSMRRFTRLTNGFSKAGLADHVWTLEEIVKLCEK